MATIHILGSCSGTEPMPGRAHTSLVITAGDRHYFFDAGECCSRTAYLAGIDLLKTRAIFLSHTHYDHIGGLAGLFWTIRKLITRGHGQVADGKVALYIPEVPAWEGIHQMLRYSEGGFKTNFDIAVDTPHFGTFYDDSVLRVTAFPAHHLSDGEGGLCRSFAYRIEVEGKTVVFSGDVGGMEDLVPVVAEGCDWLLCETGHHKTQAVCDFAESHGTQRLVLLHHGREMLAMADTARAAIDGCKLPVTVAEDGTVLEV